MNSHKHLEIVAIGNYSQNIVTSALFKTDDILSGDVESNMLVTLFKTDDTNLILSLSDLFNVNLHDSETWCLTCDNFPKDISLKLILNYGIMSFSLKKLLKKIDLLNENNFSFFFKPI